MLIAGLAAVLSASLAQTPIWLSPAELAALPTSGPAWESVLSNAKRTWGSANLSNMDSKHDTYTLAGALAGVRLGDGALKNKAMDGLRAAIGTETGNHWLAVSRNLGSYVIAADVLRGAGMRDPAVDNWLLGFFSRMINRNGGEGISGKRTMVPFKSGSNASAEEGFAYTALAAWAGDAQRLAHAWGRFRLYAGAVRVESLDQRVAEAETAALVPTSVAINISRGVGSGWSHDDADPRPINPLGSVKAGRNIDGLIINDQRRGGDFRWPPGYTHYPWVGLEGFVPAAVILWRAGFPAFDVADQAVLRAVEGQWRLGQELGQSPTCTGSCWWDFDRARDIKRLSNWAYGSNRPHQVPVAAGRTLGYTDWTHAGSRDGAPPPDPDPEPPDPDPEPPTPTGDDLTIEQAREILALVSAVVDAIGEILDRE